MPSPFQDLAVEAALPDGTPVRVLPHRAVRSAAHLLNLSLRQAEIEALGQSIIPERYLRNFKTLDHAAQARLLQTRVALVGLGGLGGPILEGLARLGFGVIRAADHDLFEPSNLNRQSLATEDTLSLSKAGAARARLEAVNPSVEFTASQLFLEPDAFRDFFADADLAVDALGGMTSRPAAQRGAALAGRPLITASVAGWTAMAATVLPGRTGPASLFCSGPPPVTTRRESTASRPACDAGPTAHPAGRCDRNPSAEAAHGRSDSEARWPDSGPNKPPCAEDVQGCLTPAIHVAVGLVLAEAVRLALGQSPRLGGETGGMAVVDLERVSLDRFILP